MINNWLCTSSRTGSRTDRQSHTLWHVKTGSKRIPCKGLINGALRTGATGVFKDTTTDVVTECKNAPLRASVPASARNGSSVPVANISFNITRKTEWTRCLLGGTIPVSVSVVPEPGLRAGRYTKITSTADVKITHRSLR